MFRTIILLVILLCSASFASAIETPETALENIQKAIDTNDSNLLEKYIDLNGIIHRGIGTFVTDYSANPPAGDADPVLDMLVTSLANGGNSQEAQSMKELLAQETRKFVLWGVSSGSFSGHLSRAQAPQDGGIFSSLFSNASVARKELRSVRVTPPKNDTTKASVKFYDHGSEKSYPVEAVLKQQPQGNWRVTDISNMAALIATVRKEAEAR